MAFLKKHAFSLYYFGLILMAVGLPLSKFLTGLSLFFIVGAWFVGGDLKQKFQLFFDNKIALLWSSVYLLHLLGLFYTSDFQYALNDLRIKLPLLLFPLIFSSSKSLTQTQFFALLKFFVAAVILSTLVSCAVLLGLIHRPVTQTRDISILISHIRLALLICLSVFILLYFIKNEGAKLFVKVMQVLAMLWLVIFLFILESFTGIVVLFSLTFLYFSYQLFQKGNYFTRLIYAAILLVSGIGLSIFLIQNYKEVTQAKPIDLTQLESHTSLGNPYLHIPQDKAMENGNYVFLYLCTRELDSVWNKRSSLDIAGLDLKKQPLRVTVFRFLTSKNLRKDAAGVSALTEAEIKSIENGIPNVNYQNLLSVKARVQQIFWELHTYRNSGNPTGHSVTMRYEYLKTGLRIYKDHPLIGVGTGDVNQAFLKKYEETQSPIALNWRLRAHNQFLTFAVTFGTIGLIWFLISIVYPIVKGLRRLDYFYFIFLFIALLSMLNDDTLESQAGVTFYAFFNALFWFNRKEPSN